MHWIPWAFSLARLKAGKSIAARMAMIAITTKSSMRVKPLLAPAGEPGNRKPGPEGPRQVLVGRFIFDLRFAGRRWKNLCAFVIMAADYACGFLTSSGDSRQCQWEAALSKSPPAG
jgi:hypothetical protein